MLHLLHPFRLGRIAQCRNYFVSDLLEEIATLDTEQMLAGEKRRGSGEGSVGGVGGKGNGIPGLLKCLEPTEGEKNIIFVLDELARGERYDGVKVGRGHLGSHRDCCALQMKIGEGTEVHGRGQRVTTLVRKVSRAFLLCLAVFV